MRSLFRSVVRSFSGELFGMVDSLFFVGDFLWEVAYFF